MATKRKVTLLARPIATKPATKTSTRPKDKAVVDDKKLSEGNRECVPLYRGGTTHSNPTPSKKGEEEGLGVDDVLDLANQLTPADRKLLLAKLALADKPALTQDDRDLGMWTEAVHHAMVSLTTPGAAGAVAPQLLKRALAGTTAWEAVSSFMAAAKFDQLEVTQRQSVYYMLADLVVKQTKHMSRRTGVPVSGKFVANVATNIAMIFDNAFPGYVAAGLAHIVALRMFEAKKQVPGK